MSEIDVSNKLTIAIAIIAVTAIICYISPANINAYKETATSYTDGYDRGYSDAVCDSNECHGHGYDTHCPNGHTNTFCNGYGNGYRNGWNGVSPINNAKYDNGNGNNADVSRSSTSGAQEQGQSIGGNDVAISGSNNRVTINDAQSQAQDLAQQTGNSYSNNRCPPTLICDDNGNMQSADGRITIRPHHSSSYAP